MIPCATILLSFLAAADVNLPTTSVGMPGRVEQLVLPGPLLQARPITDRALPVVVRIVAAYPHGDAYRYDVEYVALEAGTFDLRDYLQHQDGSRPDELPALPITVRSTLPAGQVQPNALASGRLPSVGGYRAVLIVAGALWVVGLLAILLAGRRRRRERASASAEAATLEYRLHAALAAAREGVLDAGARAELERMVLAFWRRRLALEDVEAPEAMAAMRRHAEARAALEQLERWLHDPGGCVPEDFQRLIAPAGSPPTLEQT